MRILHILRNNKFGGTQVLASYFNNLDKVENSFIFLENSDYNFFKTNTTTIKSQKEIIYHIEKFKYDLIISYVGLHALRLLFKVRYNNILISGGSKLSRNPKFFIYALIANRYPKLHIICPSNTVEKSYSHFGFKNRTIIPNPLRDVFINSKPAISRTIKYIVMTGRIDLNDRSRNWNLFCKLSKKFTTIKFIAIGDGLKRKELSEKYPHVEFKGNLGKEELLKNLSICDLFLHLNNRIEGFGIALYEAMSQGCIPISPNISINREIIKNGENGFLYNSERELELIIKELLGASPEKIHDLSKKAMNSITDKYSVNQYLKHMMNQYANINSHSNL